MGKHSQTWHAINEVLSQFGRTARKARINYQNFVREGVKCINNSSLEGGGLIRSHGGWEELSQLRKEHALRIGDERILGENQFVERALAQDDLAMEEASRLRQEGWDIDRLVQKVCNYCNIDELELLSKARANRLSITKSLICYWGTYNLGLTLREISNRLSISQPAASLWLRKGKKYCEDEGISFREIEG